MRNIPRSTSQGRALTRGPVACRPHAGRRAREPPHPQARSASRPPAAGTPKRRVLRQRRRKFGAASISVIPNVDWVFVNSGSMYSLNVDGTMSLMPLGVASVYAGAGIGWLTADPDQGDSNTETVVNLLLGREPERAADEAVRTVQVDRGGRERSARVLDRSELLALPADRRDPPAGDAGRGRADGPPRSTPTARAPRARRRATTVRAAARRTCSRRHRARPPTAGRAPRAPRPPPPRDPLLVQLVQHERGTLAARTHDQCALGQAPVRVHLQHLARPAHRLVQRQLSSGPRARRARTPWPAPRARPAHRPRWRRAARSRRARARRRAVRRGSRPRRSPSHERAHEPRESVLVHERAQRVGCEPCRHRAVSIAQPS
jgi:hypothetical protein